MTHLYIDESGDLGMGDTGSPYFILTCVKIDNDDVNFNFTRIPKKIRQTNLKKKMKETSELKFSNSSPLIRQQYLTRAKKLNIEIFSLIIEKKYTNKRLQNNLSVLYNYLIKILLEKVVEKLNRKDEL